MASLPRRRRRRPGGMGMGQYAQYPGMMSNAAPSFAGPQYYGQMLNRPPQDWSRFMPSNFQLAEGGGMHYNMNPYGYGSGGGSGWGGGFGGGGGGGGGGMFPGWPPGGGGGGGGTGGGGGGTTDTGGGKWIMTPDGQWIPRDSEQGKGLRGEGRLHGDPNFYDQDGNFVGAEGPSFSGDYNEYGQELDQHGKVLDQGVPWQDTFMAPLGHALGLDFAGYSPGQGQDMGSMTWAGGVTDDDIDDMMMNDADMGGVRSGRTPYGGPGVRGFTPPGAGNDFFGGGVTSPTGPNTGPPGSGPGTDFWGGGVTSPMGPNTGPPGSGPGVDFWGGGVTSPSGPNTGPPGSGPGVDFFGGGVTSPMGPNTGPPGSGPGGDFFGGGFLGADPEAEVEIDWGGGPDDFM